MNTRHINTNIFYIFSVAFAFAELIDNALYATSEKLAPRKIEIRLVGSL